MQEKWWAFCEVLSWSDSVFGRCRKKQWAFSEGVLAAVVTNDTTIDLSACGFSAGLSWRVPEAAAVCEAMLVGVVKRQEAMHVGFL